MLTARRPDPTDLDEAARHLRQEPRSSPEGLIAAADRGEPPRRWFVDRIEEVIGTGDEVFAAARQAVRDWRPFDQGWLEKHVPDSFGEGALVATIVRVGPMWSTNWCRITEVIDAPDTFGFTYATIAGHGERGEERFLVRQTPDGEVTFAVTAVSRPAAWYTVLGIPAVRHLQDRFRRGAVEAMRRAVTER